MLKTVRNIFFKRGSWKWATLNTRFAYLVIPLFFPNQSNPNFHDALILLSSKIIVIDFAHFSFSSFSALSQQNSFFHFFGAQTPKPAEKNWKTLKHCNSPHIRNLALPYFLNNIVQRHCIKRRENMSVLLNPSDGRWKVKPSSDMYCLLPPREKLVPVTTTFCF